MILNGSCRKSKNIIPITTYDTIETGMMDGILGGVKYLDYNVSSNWIHTIYNLEGLLVNLKITLF